MTPEQRAEILASALTLREKHANNGQCAIIVIVSYGYGLAITPMEVAQ